MSTTLQNQKQLFGHPVGLYVLFFTEMWERFSYYGMRAILVLYLVAQSTEGNAGLGWSDGEALSLYGWYTMLVYVMSIPGGIIADKLLGQKRSVLFGGILLVAGHSILAVEQMWAFYTGLGLIIAGVGLLKPNISTMVGGLYQQGDIRRDKGFTIFYIGINLGAFLSSLIVGYVGEVYGWHYGFGLAGIGMLIGLLVFMFGQKHLKNVGDLLPKDERDQGASFGGLFKELFKSPLQLIIATVLMIFSIYWLITQSLAYGALFIFLSVVVAMMMMVYKDLTTQVFKDRYLVILLSFILVIVFWGAFEQAGGLMNIYTKQNTDRDATLLTMRLIFIIPITFLVLKGIYAKIKKKNYSNYWFIGAAFIGLIFFFIDKYMFVTNPFNIPASWFQSLNALFIIILGTTIAGYWAKRKLKGKEASSLFKMAIGTMIMGFGFVFMVFAAMEFESNGESAMYWLVLAYLFHTIGELCSSPVALSFITKLAPVKYASLMMGVYFASTGLGNKVAGVVGESASDLGEYTVFFGILGFTVLFGLIVVLMLKPLKRLTHGAEDDERIMTNH